MNIIKNYGIFLVIGIAIFITLAFLSLLQAFNKDTEYFANSVLSFSQAANKPSFVKDELLLKFKEGVSAADEQEIIRNSNIKVKKEISQIKVKVISVPEQALDAVKQALSKNPKVEFVENNYIAEVTAVPNDPEYAKQWYLPKISAPNAWDISTGAQDVVIAITDTGIDMSNPEFADKILPGYNFYDNNSDASDINGHGTKVAGTVSAIGNNNLGIAGVSWPNSIMPLRITDSNGSGPYSALASAVTYAADHGANIINISWGGTSYSSTVQSAINYAWSKGLVIVAAAGNNGNEGPFYPAAMDNVLAAGATDSSDNLANFSCYGSWVDVTAPGMMIYTSLRGGGYGYVSGTSFSSPITAGVAALVMAANPDLKNSDVVNLIKNNTDDLGTAGFDIYYGWGRVNATKALNAASSVTPSIDNIAPTAAITSPLDNDTVSGTKIVAISSSDNVGVMRVELWKDDAIFASSISYPYSFVWDTTKDTNGSHNLVAKAYDAAGNIGTSDPVNVIVENVSDAISPTVSINEPTNNSVISKKGTFLISASANDNVGVTEIQLFFDGTLISSCAQINTCETRVNQKKIDKGSHSVSAKAYDAVGNMGTSNITILKK